MSKIKLGDFNDLVVTRLATRDNPHQRNGKETFGVFLDGGDEGDILMPMRYVPEGTKPGDELRVLVYLDQDERPIATTEQPLCKVGEFGWLECTWVNQYGAFLDWGPMKNVFCPFSEQKRKMEKGQRYLVFLYVDEESYRLVASAKVDDFLSTRTPPYQTGEAVNILVWQKTPLGFKVIVDNLYPALIYDNQIFRPVHTGDRLVAYVSRIREDGKLDLSLQPTGYRQTQDFAETLYDWMLSHNGYCPLGDKSAPDDIKRLFHVSKKVFKRAVGDLYKKRHIEIKEDGLHIVR